MASASESDSASEISLELSSQSVSFDDGSELKGSEEKGHRETAQQPVRGPGVVM